MARLLGDVRAENVASHGQGGEAVECNFEPSCVQQPKACCHSGLLNAALGYAALGWPVFPCHGKQPAIPRGFYGASTDPAKIRHWWEAQNYNIAVRTGMASRAWVLDVDGAEGMASLEALEALFGKLPATWQAVTARGRHVWFANSSPLPSSIGRLGAGLDVRADGAYCIAPPSVHVDGPIYRWCPVGNLPPGELAKAPSWLVKLAYHKQASEAQPLIEPVTPSRRTLNSVYGLAALKREAADLARTTPGFRNQQLNRAAFVLFQLVAGGEIAQAEVVEQLIDACRANGLWADDGPQSCLATIASARRAGAQHPRFRPKGRIL